jgi:hypothetical protein
MAGRATHADGQMAGQEQSDEVTAEAGSGVFMACILQSGKLGISSYDSTSAEVRLSLRVSESGAQMLTPRYDLP